tara:strand:- start:2363 stop:2740 length:378 start_codon:yes stop_codon:yes gene_type:complete
LNVIFLIGDGMDLSQISAGMYANNNQTVLEDFPVIGLSKTYAVKSFVTDSAASVELPWLVEKRHIMVGLRLAQEIKNLNLYWKFVNRMDTIRDLLPTPILFMQPLNPFMPMWAPEKKRRNCHSTV